MKTSYLFPYRFKKISGIVFWVSLVLLILLYSYSNLFNSINPEINVFTIRGEPIFEKEESGTFLLAEKWFTITKTQILDEILFLLLIVSGLIYAFSKEKTEDEMVSKIRLDSLVWATYFNYIVILLGYLFVYGFAFLNVMMVALFSHLLFFIIRFRWIMYKQNKSSGYEE